MRVRRTANLVRLERIEAANEAARRMREELAIAGRSRAESYATTEVSKELDRRSACGQSNPPGESIRALHAALARAYLTGWGERGAR